MKSLLRASLALGLTAMLGLSAASAQAPATTPAPATPAPAAAPKAAAPAPAAAKPTDDIVATANKAGNLKTLAKLLDAADLTKTLQGKGPFTVFAPTDEAFAKLPKEQVDALLKPENKRSLASTLNAHVVAGKAVKSERFVKAKGLYLRMANNSVIAVDAKDPKAIKWGAAAVSKADVEATNGIIHIVNAVYVPKRVRTVLYSKEKAAQAKAAAGPALEKAKEATGKAVEKAKEVGGKAVEATKDAAGKAMDKAKELTGSQPAPADPAKK